MNFIHAGELPQDLEFTTEWRVRLYDRDGNEWEHVRSCWYGENEDGEAIVKSLVNREYPDPTPLVPDSSCADGLAGGLRYIIEWRFVSEPRTAKE